jgi:ribosome biogenesis protein Nip4
MIEKFISQFTDNKIEYEKTGREYYLMPPSVKSLISEASRLPLSAGVYLGMEDKKGFRPSLALLEMISRSSDRKVFVNSGAEWLFLCGRDLFGKGIKKANVEKGLVLVQNENDENLGYGRIVGKPNEKNRVVVKNLLDRGDFLRRERKK